ncbi:MAG: LysR family transcriptional regulator [Clostridia bacterium]|nr:LysR family transcriptional regulator [Clostridia bacterium]
MRMQDLNCFVAVVDKGGVTSAAEALYMTQSSVSKSLARLEKTLGVRLFDRSRRSLGLTEAGRAALPHARLVLEAGEAMMRSVSGQRQTLRVGVLPILDSYGLAARLPRFTQLHPELQLQVIEMDNRAIGEALAEGTLDAALYRPAGGQKKLYVQPLRPDELVLLLPENHPMAAWDPVPLEKCSGEKFIILSRSTQLHDVSIEACRQAGFTPDVVYTGSSGAAFARLVREQTGVALLLESVAQSLAGGGLCVRRLSRQIRGDLCFVCAESRKKEAALQKLLTMLQQSS